MKYVIGLAFNIAHDRALLQLKRKGPDMNIGFLNPPGGKVHQYPTVPGEGYGKYESFNGAMRREFLEETGLESQQGDWLNFHFERHPSGAELHCFTTDKLDVYAAKTTTDEPNCIVEFTRSRGAFVPYGYLWCPNADSISGGRSNYEEAIKVQTSLPRGGLAYYMPYLLPMAVAYLEHPEHRYLEG